MDTLSFQQREYLFHSLAQLSRGGISLGKAFDLLARNSDRQVGSCVRTLIASLQNSESVGEAFHAAGFSQSAMLPLLKRERRVAGSMQFSVSWLNSTRSSHKRDAPSSPSQSILCLFYLCVMGRSGFWRLTRSLLSRSSRSAKTIIPVPVLGRFLLNGLSGSLHPFSRSTLQRAEVSSEHLRWPEWSARTPTSRRPRAPPFRA